MHLFLTKFNTPKLGNVQIAYRKNRKRYKNPSPVQQEVTKISPELNNLANDLIHLEKLQKGELVRQEDDILKRNFPEFKFLNEDN